MPFLQSIAPGMGGGMLGGGMGGGMGLLGDQPMQGQGRRAQQGQWQQQLGAYGGGGAGGGQMMPFGGGGGGFGGGLLAPFGGMGGVGRELARMAPEIGTRGLTLDITEDANKFTVKANVPGVPRDGVHLDLDTDSRTLSITARADKSEEREQTRGGIRYHVSERGTG
jgi:hypothetical protein